MKLTKVVGRSIIIIIDQKQKGRLRYSAVDSIFRRSVNLYPYCMPNCFISDMH